MGVWRRRVTDTGPRKVLEFFVKSQFMSRKFVFGVEAEQGEQLAQFVNWRLNWERYVNMILNRVLPEITQEERLSCFFQQDSAAAHTAGNSVVVASDVFNGRVTSRRVIFVSVVAWKTASTEEIPTYCVNLEWNIQDFPSRNTTFEPGRVLALQAMFTSTDRTFWTHPLDGKFCL
jgi:hypothetical protein